MLFSQTKLFFFLFILGYTKLLGTDGYYISPGIQIGINSSKEYFFSYQTTFGLNEDYGFPGITVGRRHYKTELNKWNSYNYIDAQIAFVTIGTGVGMIFDNSNIFYKYKLFAGYFGLVTYDYINFKNKPKMHFGGFVVFPITNDCFWCF